MEVLRTVRLACGIALLGASTAVGQTSFHEGFEGPEPILKPAGGDAPYRIAAQQIVRQSPHSGVGSEVLKIAAENGQSVYFSVDIGNGLVIADLAPSVWLKADRPGLQVFLRAVLPRTRHPQTGQPLTTLIPGTGYTQTGQWQQLHIERIDQLFERQVRALRAEHGKHLDPTGAFVDRLVLNVYAGPGATTVWIDDVDIAGLIHPQSVSSGVPTRQISSQPSRSGVGERLPASWTGSNGQAEGAHRSIQLSGSSLMVDQTPLFPRIIEHQGESLAFLRSLGFNGVLLASRPSAELLREASAAGMWLIAQPPSLEELQQQPNATIGAQYAPVLAWHLGSRLGVREAEHIRTWAKLIKRADSATRPIIATPDAELRTYSRNLDALIVSRESLGTTLDLWDYHAWLRERPQLARLGTPLWSTVPSQMPAKCREQVIGLTAGRISEAELAYSQMRAVSLLSLAAGTRGLVVRSDAPLDGSDRSTQARSARLSLLNLELQLIEPWTVSACSSAIADCSDSSLIGLVLSTQRGRLLVPLPKASGQQAAFGGWPTGPISFTIPGASTASDAFELTPAGIRPLAHNRIAGGIRIVLDGSHESMVVLTHDRLLLTTLTKRVEKIAERAIELQRLSVGEQLASAVSLEPVANETTDGKDKTASPITVARQLLSSVGTDQKHSDPTERWRKLISAQETIANVQHKRLQNAAGSSQALVSNPLWLHPISLPSAGSLATTSSSSQPTVPGGDFESLEALIQQGWRHFENPASGLSQSVELSADGPRSGRYSLRLAAATPQSSDSPAVESPPLWITSPAINVQAGQRLLVRGWVRVPVAITGSVDGLMIVDSLGGEPLALRVRDGGDWKPFTLVRAASTSGPMTVTFVLTGCGVAHVDDVSVEILDARSPIPSAELAQPWIRPGRR